MSPGGPDDPKYRDDPAMVAYASERGLSYSRVLMPDKSTQLLRHGTFQETWDGMQGALPGGLQGKLMHWDYGDVEKPARFTVVLAAMPESVELVSRLLCHDRTLSDEVRSDPDAGSRVVSLDDQAVRLESDAFLRRYTLATDHDTDQNAVWQLFEPDFIDWLVTKAPEGVSFEVQEGSLVVFVTGSLTDPDALDRLCGSASHIAGKISAEAEERKGAAIAPGPPTAPGSRDEILERELAQATFEETPKDVKHAAGAFRAGPIRTERSWKLGEEAFFREYARTLGLAATDTSAFRAAHLNLGFPGRLAHVVAGTIAWLGLPGYLVFSDLEDGDANGWASIAVERPVGASMEAFTAVNDACFERNCHLFYDAGTTSLCQDGGGTRTRTRAELDEFVAFAKAQMSALLGLA